MARILIKNGHIWNGEKFLYGDIFTAGSVVEKIAESIHAEADFVMDACGKIVTAGLVDLHVHMRGTALPEFGIQAEMGCFPFGVTAANDAGSLLGNEAMLAQFALKNTVFIGCAIKNNHAMLSALEPLLERYGKRAVGIKVYLDTTQADVRDQTPLREVCAFAEEKKLKVMVHCSHSPISVRQITETLRNGDIITHAYHGGENSSAADGFLGLMEAYEKGVIVDTGFAGHVHTDFQVFTSAVQAGMLPDTISTDITRYSAYTRGGRYGMTMCMSIARTAGMQEKDILRAVTSRPAEVLGKEKEWGYLQEGRTADIAVLDYVKEEYDLTDSAGNRMADEKSYRCIFTVIDGQVVYRD
jgi:dihydroorotase